MRIAAVAVPLQAVIASVGSASVGSASVGLASVGVVSAGVLDAQAPTDATLFVSANMDIYKAGGYEYYSYGGVPPYSYTFPAGAYKGLAFLDVSGTWTCNDPQNEPYGADGTSNPDGGCYPRANIEPTGPFSGYSNTDYQGAMVGMFLEDSLPTTVAPTLRFYVSDGSQGGIQTRFAALSPEIGQVFFVGDGLTGTGTGERQLFIVPPGATQLYLGYVDSPSSTGTSSPTNFFDNGGAMVATFRMF